MQHALTNCFNCVLAQCSGSGGLNIIWVMQRMISTTFLVPRFLVSPFTLFPVFEVTGRHESDVLKRTNEHIFPR